MFTFLYSEQKKMRQNAENWLEVADRVHKFRRDLLTDGQNQKLLTAAGTVKQRLKERADASKLKLAIESLEGVLRDTGGRLYPVSSMIENVEFFVVAAIVILGLRAYFVQPFKIPTNSMWPTYYGQTHETDAPGENPGILSKVWRLATLGAWHYQVNAPADGELLLPVFSDGRVAFTQKPGRKFFIFPTTEREYTFSVGGLTASVTIPGSGTSTEDFKMEKALGDMLRQHAVLPRVSQEMDGLVNGRRNAALENSTMIVTFEGRKYEKRINWVPTGRMVKKDEPIMSFDLLTGDMLFVDRISFNFIRPQVGQGFVFQTQNIPDIGTDQYFVKRLVGTPGDVLEIKEPVLWRNGQPITGGEAFSLNAKRTPPYRGYFYPTPGNAKYLGQGEELKIPPGRFFAMGDNSLESADSRYWGFVPEKDVVGRPLFIYYPLTKRWGPAK
ncbi:MAG TPA: signal peptidase I [Lacunisphaera sp.]|nr:signal peptidase I [Lacunisphaera sp.]